MRDPALRRSAHSLALSGALAVLIGTLGIGCISGDPVGRIVVQAGVPGARAEARVHLLGKKAGYLDALVATGGRNYRFFFPDTPTCRALLTAPIAPAYSPLGRGGRLEGGDRQCAPAGILNLAEWRKGRGRVAGEMVPRAQASYRVERRHAGVALARGRFPLVSRLGFSGGTDVIAVLPDDERCAAALRSRTASLEYRTGGPDPLTLVAGGAPCPILGILFPDRPPEDPPTD